MADITEQQEQVLIENCNFVIKQLDADDVIDELIQERLIGENASQRIGLVTTSRVDKNRIILEQLSIAGPGALERFCNILKKKKRQAFIATKLEECFHSPTVKNSLVDYTERLKSRYLRQLPTAKTDWPKHKVTEYIRLALVEQEDVTLKNENLNEVTKLTLQGDVDRILKKKQPLADLREIFHYENKPCPRLIVIMGGPGIGKTTLANEICLKWARDGFLSDDFDAVLLLPMRCVQQRSLEQVMIEFTGEEAYQQLKRSAGNRCLIILEGLDEMAADRQRSDHFFVSLIKHCSVLEKSIILITSRPHACNELDTDRRVEVIGFGADEIKEFTKKSFPNDEHSVSELLQYFNDYPHLKGLCYCPLNLIMVTDIFRSSQDNKLPSTLTELYKVFLVMILHREVKKCLGVSPTEADSDSLKIMLPGIPLNAIGTVLLLCRLSFCGIFDWHVDMQRKDWGGCKKKWKDPKIIFTAEDLKKCAIEVYSEFDGFGLLKATHIHEIPIDTSAYNFSHLSIQEFLASLYISLLPQEEQLCLMNEYFHDFPNVFIFLCGLRALKCNEMYHIVYSKIISNNPYSIPSSNPDVVPAVRCIYEGNCTVQSAVPFTLDMSANHLVLFDCFCVSHVLSNYPVAQLKLQFCHIGDTGSEVLVKDHSNEKATAHLLELLDLTLNDLTAVGMEHLMKIVMTSSSTLRELNVSNNDIGDSGTSMITEWLQFNKTLTRLNVSECKFSVKGASCFDKLLKVNNTLQELNLRGNAIGDDGMSLVSDGLQYNKALTKLNVRHCGLSVKGAGRLGELLKVNNSLLGLSVGGNNIGNDGMSLVADGLQYNKSLTKLNIHECGLSVEGAISVSQALMVNQTLLELDIMGNQIGDDGITAIAGVLSNSSIILLDVMACGISVVGARLIMKSAAYSAVCKDVWIDSKHYDDEEVKRLKSILDDRRRQNTSNKDSSKDEDSSEGKLLEKLHTSETSSCSGHIRKAT